MKYKGLRCYIRKGLNKGAWGRVVHEDRDAVHIVTDDGFDVYDRKENVVVSSS